MLSEASWEPDPQTDPMWCEAFLPYLAKTDKGQEALEYHILQAMLLPLHLSQYSKVGLCAHQWHCWLDNDSQGLSSIDILHKIQSHQFTQAIHWTLTNELRAGIPVCNHSYFLTGWDTNIEEHKRFFYINICCIINEMGRSWTSVFYRCMYYWVHALYTGDTWIIPLQTFLLLMWWEHFFL